MDPAIYILICAMATLLIVVLIISNTATAAGGAVMPHPIFPHDGPYNEHGEKQNGTGMLY